MSLRAQRFGERGSAESELIPESKGRERAAPAALSRPRVALVGPPNTGKSTLFNSLTGLRQNVGNYPGVTVERRSGVARLSTGEVELIDLPGVLDMTPRSPDQKITRDVLTGRGEERRPDAVIVILDATRLSSHLVLAEPVLALGLPSLVALTMSDELARRGGSLSMRKLSKELGVHVALVNARRPDSLGEVKRFLSALHTGGPEARACPAVAVAGSHAAPAVGRPLPIIDDFAARRKRAREVGRIAEFQDPRISRRTNRLDAVFLHRLMGPCVFLAVVVLVFQSIFAWAIPLMDLTEGLIQESGAWMAQLLGDGWIRSLIVDGVWAGVGSVVVFLPQILILFFFLAILEQSGYMARAAVIADRAMQKVGLQGASFLPLASGFACAVPAVMAARTVENERDRMATIFVLPFMACSARLPVYALLIAAFIPQTQVAGPFLSSRAAVLLGLYLLGILAAVGTAALLKRTVLADAPAPFVMELPPYRLPTARAVAAKLVERARIFLRRAGRVILAVTIILWALTQFPRTPQGPPPIEESALGRIGQVVEPAIKPLGLDWRFGVGLVTSLAAREVIVGTLGTIYGVESGDENSLELQQAMQANLDLGSAVGLLVFFVFALQCMSTVAVMRRETGGWKWPAAQFGYMLALAYLGAWSANALF